MLLAFRNSPIDSIHQYAVPAAEAGECAGQQGKFWEMHDLLFGLQGNLSDEAVRGAAAQARLDLKLFERCRAGDVSAKVHQDQQLAHSLGVEGTPTFMMGLIRRHDEVQVLSRIVGAGSPDKLKAELNKFLSRTGA